MLFLAGKTHGAFDGSEIGGAPEAADLGEQQLGWAGSFQEGTGSFTSGLEVTWSKTPTKWSNNFLESLFHNTWSLVESPGGAHQWEALNATANYPLPFDNSSFQKPRMLTSDLALLHDPIYNNISQVYLANFTKLTDDFSRACKSCRAMPCPALPWLYAMAPPTPS